MELSGAQDSECDEGELYGRLHVDEVVRDVDKCEGRMEHVGVRMHGAPFEDAQGIDSKISTFDFRADQLSFRLRLPPKANREVLGGV